MTLVVTGRGITTLHMRNEGVPEGLGIIECRPSEVKLTSRQELLNFRDKI